jgi:hypothetical protein
MQARLGQQQRKITMKPTYLDTKPAYVWASDKYVDYVCAIKGGAVLGIMIVNAIAITLMNWGAL